MSPSAGRARCGPVHVVEPHVPDREVQLVQPAEDTSRADAATSSFTTSWPVWDASVEAPVFDCEKPEVRERRRAARLPRALIREAPFERLRQRSDARLVLLAARRARAVRRGGEARRLVQGAGSARPLVKLLDGRLADVGFLTKEQLRSGESVWNTDRCTYGRGRQPQRLPQSARVRCPGSDRRRQPARAPRSRGRAGRDPDRVVRERCNG